MARAFRISSTQMIWLVSLWLVLFYNSFFWNSVWRWVGGTDLKSLTFLGSLFVVAVACINILLNLISFGWLTRISLALVLCLSALAAYFMNHFNVLIDAEMIQNVLATDIGEAFELMSLSTFAYMLVLGIIPSIVVVHYLNAPRTLLKELFAKLASMGLSVLLITSLLLPLFQSYASLARNHRDLRLMLTPSNYILGLYNYSKTSLSRPPLQQPVSIEANRSMHWMQQNKHAVLILVVGETARSANFSLGGYARNTNPELAQKDVIYFGNVHSCGTATAVSLPCMFSNYAKESTDSDESAVHYGMLDVLKQAGFQLLWRDNNSGCKSTCSNIPYQSLAKLQNADFCSRDGCYDEVLLEGMQAYLDDLTSDSVIVLHQKGSHGPAYFMRYPSQFEKFLPVCLTSELQRCTQQEIVNAYDNTLLYTDFVLSKLIDLLQQNSTKFDTGMLYVSDHGESLGENNFYLHGAPYAIAPRNQTHIPMILWLSQGFRNRIDLDWSCLTAHRNADFSHYNLFHSVLGLLQIESPAYFQGLDIFHGCTPPG